MTTSALTLGTHTSITAVYAGDTFSNSSTSNCLTETVEWATAVTIAASVSVATYGQTITFTATVVATPSSGGIPTGDVSFTDQITGFSLGSVALDGGVATLQYSGLSLGAHVVTATYSGDATHLGCTTSVGGGSTITTVAISAFLGCGSGDPPCASMAGGSMDINFRIK